MCQEMLTRSSPDTVLPTSVGPQIPIQNTFYSDTHTVPNVNMLDVPLTSAYTIFYNEKRLLLSQENPSSSFSLFFYNIPALSDEEIDKKIEQLWNELTPNQRKSYVSTMSIPRFPTVDWSRCVSPPRSNDLATICLALAIVRSKRGLARSPFRITSRTNSQRKRVARIFSTV